MLKIISENLVFFEDGKPFEGKIAGFEELSTSSNTETITAIIQNILYLIYNVSYAFKDVVSKALNDNSSQHAFKKIKRVYGQSDPTIADFCYNLLRLQFDNMSKKKKTANMNLQIVSDNFLSSSRKSEILSSTCNSLNVSRVAYSVSQTSDKSSVES